MVPDNLNWQPVQSSNLLEVAYHFPHPNDMAEPAGGPGDLYVKFGGGGRTETVYVYRSVPQHEFVHLLAAESKGKYLNASIKGKYDYEGPL